MEQAISQLEKLTAQAQHANTAAGKQRCKQALHTLLNASQQQFSSFLDDGSSSPLQQSASSQLLAALQPHLHLPNPYDSITCTCMAFQILERVLQHLCSQHQQQQQQGDLRHVKPEQPANAAAPDEKQGRDTSSSSNTPAVGAGSKKQQQLLLCQQLHACAGLCWRAMVSKPSDLAFAHHALQYQRAAQDCAVLIHAYCRTAGGGDMPAQMQEALVGLLLHGSMQGFLRPAADSTTRAAAKAASGAALLVAVKQEEGKEAAATSVGVPLLASLKALMRSSKAYTAAAKAASASKRGGGSSGGARATTPPPNNAGAAGGGASGGAASTPVSTNTPMLSATWAARAEELSVSGIKAWGLVAAELGPRLLDKAVGQPMLDVSSQ